MDNLATCWEWDVTTGNPVFPHPPRVVNWRYIPSVAEMAGLVHKKILIDPVRAHELVQFMHSNEMRTFFIFDQEWIHHNCRSFMTLIRALNLKKVAVRLYGGGRLQVDKLPRESPFTGAKDQFRNSGNSRLQDIQDDINRNALVGSLGPGTYPCHHQGCTLCAKTGRSPIVRLGPHGVLHLTKRSTCTTRNVVYIGVCSRCEELPGNDDWCVYFGETGQPLQRRCNSHMSDPCNSASALKDLRTAAARRAKIGRVLAGVDEEEGILQDWYPHICVGGIHEGRQQMSVVDVLPLRVARVNRETGLVLQHMMLIGAIDYRGNGRGCVNTYHEDRE